MTFVWEPARRVPGLTSRRTPERPEASRLDVEVLGEDGQPPLFEGAIAPATPGSVGEAAQTQAVFDAPPGRLRLRMSVRGGAAGEELDQDVRAITVRSLDGAVTMGSAAVVRTFNGRDYRALVGIRRRRRPRRASSGARSGC